MDLKHKAKFYFYLICGLSIAPVKAHAQPEISGTTAILTVGSFLVCLVVFFLLIRLQSRSEKLAPNPKLTRKEKRSQMKHSRTFINKSY